jgi:hypothetical protein
VRRGTQNFPIFLRWSGLFGPNGFTGARPGTPRAHPSGEQASFNTGIAYLTAAVRARPNLSIRAEAEVDSEVIQGKQAVGVALVGGERLFARRGYPRRGHAIVSIRMRQDAWSNGRIFAIANLKSLARREKMAENKSQLGCMDDLVIAFVLFEGAEEQDVAGPFEMFYWMSLFEALSPDRRPIGEPDFAVDSEFADYFYPKVAPKAKVFTVAPAAPG